MLYYPNFHHTSLHLWPYIELKHLNNYYFYQITPNLCLIKAARMSDGPVIIIDNGTISNTIANTSALIFYDDLNNGNKKATPWLDPATPATAATAAVRARIRLIVLRDTTSGILSYWRAERNETAAPNTNARISVLAGTVNKVIQINQTGPGLVDVNLQQDNSFADCIRRSPL